MAVETTTLVRYYEATVTQGPGLVDTARREKVRIMLAGVIQDLTAANLARAADAARENLRGQLADLREQYRQLEAEDRLVGAPFAATFMSFPLTPPEAEEDWWREPVAVARSLGLVVQDFSSPEATPQVVAHVLANTATVPLEPWPGYAQFGKEGRREEFAQKYEDALLNRPSEDYAHALNAAVANYELALHLHEEAAGAKSGDQAAAERFAYELIDQPVVPIEESPLSGASLAELLSRAPNAAGAAVAAWGTGPDQPLLLFITIPTGIIIFGAATGVAKALNEGLRAKILGWMGVPDPLQPPAPSEPTPPMPDEPSEPS